MSEENKSPKNSDGDRVVGRTWADVFSRIPVYAFVIVFVLIFFLILYIVVFSKAPIKIAGFEIGVSADSIPSGAVIAFAKGCPLERGWVPYEKARGRSIVGSGSQSVVDIGTVAEIRTEITNETVGGSRMRLAPRILPATPIDPNTKYDPSASNLLLSRNTSVIKETDGPDRSVQFYVLPPYVALEYCVKK